MPAGVAYALSAALLFGLGTPLAKLLLVAVHPLMLAALLYLGSGLGLALWRLLRRDATQLPRGSEWAWLVAACMKTRTSRRRIAEVLTIELPFRRGLMPHRA